MSRTVISTAAVLASGVVASAAMGWGDPKAEAILKASGEAMRATKSLVYNAEATLERTIFKDGAGAKEPRVSIKAEVMVKRADESGIGWKLYVGGEIDRAGQVDPDRLHVAFDGFAARSIKESKKEIYEKGAKELADLEAFLVVQGAKDVLLWEMISAAPLSGGAGPGSEAGSESRIEGTKVIGGEKCDVVVVKWAESEVRYFISSADRLPRRIESDMAVEPPAPAAGGDAKPDAGDAKAVAPVKKDRLARTLLLSNIKRDLPITESTFLIDVPDEFVVRAVKDPAPPKAPVLAGKDGGKPKQKTQTPGMLAPGTAAPPWTLKDGDGKDVSLASFRGKVVVLDFWGTWCPPCRAAIPSMEKIYQKYKTKGVVVIGMDIENDPAMVPKATKFLRDLGGTYPVVLHAETIADTYRVPGYPGFYVIDRAGDIVWGSVGFNKASQDEHERVMSEAIDEALAEGV